MKKNSFQLLYFFISNAYGTVLIYPYVNADVLKDDSDESLILLLICIRKSSCSCEVIPCESSLTINFEEWELIREGFALNYSQCLGF